MKWLLYDDQVTGHHLPYLRLIDAELVRRNQAPLVASPTPPVGPDERWIELQQVPYRHLVKARRQMSRVVRRARQHGADTLVDLFFDKNGWVVGASKGFPHRVHVLHHIDQLARGARIGMSGVGSAALRWRVTQADVGGGAIVVHTATAAAQMSEVFGPSRIFQAALPVETSPRTDLPDSDGRPVLAFVGGARHEKGLDLLADALQMVGDDVVVRVLGPQPPGTVSAFNRRFSSVPTEWRTEVFSVADLRTELAASSLVVLPYRSRFGLYGGSSASLLDAMAVGAPIVVSPAIADQVAPGYGCVTAAEDEDPEALAEAIRIALQSLPYLTRRARAVGPAYVAEHHSVSSYVDVLTRAAQASGEDATWDQQPTTDTVG